MDVKLLNLNMSDASYWKKNQVEKEAQIRDFVRQVKPPATWQCPDCKQNIPNTPKDILEHPCVKKKIERA